MGHFKEHELVIVFPIANTLIVIVHWAVKNAAFLPTESRKLCQDIDQIRKGQSVYVGIFCQICMLESPLSSLIWKTFENYHSNPFATLYLDS